MAKNIALYYAGLLCVNSQKHTIFVCDVCCVQWLQAALREQPPVVMLVGNKTDQHSKREVTSEDGRQLALV